MNSPWVFTLITAFGFGGWPLVVRSTKLSPIMTSLIIGIGTIIPILIASPFFKIGNVTKASLITCLIAAMINGIGFVSYTIIITRPEWAPTYIPVTVVTMTAIMVLGGVLLFKDPLSLQKSIGFVLGIISIWLLTK